MTTSTRSAAARLLLPAPRQPPRPLSISFETSAIRGLSAEQRVAAIQALAAMPVHAAGLQLSGDDDEQQ